MEVIPSKEHMSQQTAPVPLYLDACWLAHPAPTLALGNATHIERWNRLHWEPDSPALTDTCKTHQVRIVNQSPNQPLAHCVERASGVFQATLDLRVGPQLLSSECSLKSCPSSTGWENSGNILGVLDLGCRYMLETLEPSLALSCSVSTESLVSF